MNSQSNTYELFELGKNVTEYVKDVFEDYKDLYKITSNIGTIICFGGVPRNFEYFDKKIIDQLQFRDLDLVISDTSNEKLFKYYSKVVHRRTRFGGIQCKLKNKSVDIWALNDTWAFKNGLLLPTIENLPKSVFLNIDAIIVRLDNGAIIENGFYKALRRREIDIVLEENPFPALCVLRALVYRKKYNFTFSNRLKEYIICYLSSNKNALMDLMRMQMTHYEGIIIQDKSIEHEIDRYVLN